MFKNNKEFSDDTKGNDGILFTYERINDYKDAYIADAFSVIPHTLPFINYFLKQGKIMISQISESDIEEAANNSRGIGNQTIDQINEMYNEYKKFPIKIDDKFKSISIEKIFGNSIKEELFTLHCIDFEIVNVWDLKCIIIAAAQLRGIRPSYMEENFLELLLDASTNTDNDTVGPLFLEEEIPYENINLPIEYLKYFGISYKDIDLLKENKYLKLEDLINKSFSLKIYRIIIKSANIIKQPYIYYFINALKGISQEDRRILLLRIKGNTLNDIGKEVHLTKERIRQKIIAINKHLINGADIIAEALMLKGKFYLSYKDLLNEFSSNVEADICWYVLKHSERFIWLSYTDKTITKAQYLEDLKNTLY